MSWVRLLAALAATALQAPSDEPRCLAAPADAAIVESFVEPPCPYCAGHRGLGFDTDAGAPVRAAADGVVTFSGPVAGRIWLVVAHGGGLRTSYGPLVAAVIPVGRVVDVGDILGAAAVELHFGLRRGDTYLDPQPWLGRWRTRARLVPLDGSTPRPAPGHLECTSGGGPRPDR